MRTEWKHFGLLRLFIAGAPAGLTYMVTSLARSLAFEEMNERGFGYISGHFKSLGKRRILRFLLSTLDRV